SELAELNIATSAPGPSRCSPADSPIGLELAGAAPRRARHDTSRLAIMVVFDTKRDTRPRVPANDRRDPLLYRLVHQLLVVASVPLKRDEIGMNHHRALGCCLRMIFSENRFTLFRIML